MRPWAFVCPLSLISACVGEAPTDRPRPEYIRNGSEDQGDPAVVSLMNQGRSFCTGTLVTRNVVVTAAHCVAALNPEQVFFGFQVGGQGRLVAVETYESHPGYNASLNTSDFDIAVLGLAEEVTDVTPMPMNSRPLTADWIGNPVRMIGFGNTEAGNGSSGVKRQGTSSISEYDQNGIVFGDDPSGLCFGDSGGPSFIDVGEGEVFFGVHWKVGGGDRNTGTCQPPNFDTRVDAYLSDFIQPFIEGRGGGGQQPDPGDPGDPGPGDGPGQDPDPGQDPGGDCGGVTNEGQCSGTALQYCYFGTLVEVDCASYGLTCGWVEEEQWYDCVASGGGGGGGGGGAGCDYDCDTFGYAEGQCLAGWQCLGGCLEWNGCDL